MMSKNDEKTISLSSKELIYLFYALICTRDHHWHSGHNRCIKRWDLAKDFCAITIEDLIPRLQEKERAELVGIQKII